MTEAPVRVVGRYALHGEIAAGGMATVHLGRLLGPVGFAKTVAIKRLHPQFAKDPEFVTMFLDEARLAARIQHPNVVSTLDVVSQDGELFLVMEYIEGESLARLIRGVRAVGARLPPTIVGTIMAAALYGLHAAHEAKGPDGQPLGIIHRDISPQNIHVGLDGVSRVLDFGVAKAANRAQITREGQLKGKLAYMAPEQILEDEFDRRVDVYAAGVVLWEALCAQRLFDGENEGKILKKILSTDVVPPSSLVPGLSPHVDAIVLRALSKEPSERYATAWELAVAIEETLGTEPPRRLGAFVESLARDGIAKRTARVRQLESAATELDAPLLAARPSDPSAMERTVAKREQASARAILAVLAILGLGATAALLILLLKRGRDPEPSAGAAPGPAATASESPRAAEPTAASPDRAAVAPSSAAALASPSASAAATTPRAVTPRQTATTVARPTATTTAASDPCKVPTYYENGIKKIKPECLK